MDTAIRTDAPDSRNIRIVDESFGHGTFQQAHRLIVSRSNLGSPTAS